MFSVEVVNDGAHQGALRRGLRWFFGRVSRFVQRLREGVPFSAFCRGLWLRRHFQAAGLILALPGGRLPTIKNRGGRIEIESCSFEPEVRVELSPGATLRIGKGTYLNRNVRIVVAEAVTIGRGTKIGWDVVIMDTDLHGHSGLPAVQKPVVIEDNVWIGCRALILKGVRIGEGAVIAAGAIVTKDVPPRAIVASPRADIVSMTEPMD